jgi:hypothetical protein
MGFQVIHLHRLKDFLVELYFDVRTQSFSGCRLVGDDDLLNLLYDETNQQIKLPFLFMNKHQEVLKAKSKS